MIRFITGLPGAGKTQYAISCALKEKRPVYYCNLKITEKPGGWSEWDFKRWMELPAGALLIVDEAQDFALATSSTAEDWVRDLAKHRHYGLDIWLITQDPKQLHAYIRRLAGEWHEVVRVFGRNVANINIRATVEATAPICESKIWGYDKEVWKLYNSATVHTRHGRLPWKFAAGAAAVIIGLVLVGWKWQTAGMAAVNGEGARAATSKILQQTESGKTQVSGLLPSPPSVGITASVTCSVLVGILSGESRAILVFENADSSTWRKGVHPADLKDEITVDGCRYSLAAGSLYTFDPVARQAVYDRKRSENERAAEFAAQQQAAQRDAQNPERHTKEETDKPIPAEKNSEDAILAAVRARNSKVLRQALASTISN